MNNRITEGVGKRIVDALKQQNEAEEIVQNDSFEEFEETFTPEATVEAPVEDFDTITEVHPQINQTFVTPGIMKFTQPAPLIEKETFAADLDDFEVPTNVAVLKQLINQLPNGVSKQTGAQIIKQTMEALGISMKGVLQEAQQVQESLNNSSRECQASIIEYKKQIGILERQSQKLQRQYVALNDIISLFVQTSI